MFRKHILYCPSAVIWQGVCRVLLVCRRSGSPVLDPQAWDLTNVGKIAREEGGLTGTYDGGNLHVHGAEPQARATEPLEDGGCGFITCDQPDAGRTPGCKIGRARLKSALRRAASPASSSAKR
jgi:hypothetical protein